MIIGDMVELDPRQRKSSFEICKRLSVSFTRNKGHGGGMNLDYKSDFDNYFHSSSKTNNDSQVKHFGDQKTMPKMLSANPLQSIPSFNRDSDYRLIKDTKTPKVYSNNFMGNTETKQDYNVTRKLFHNKDRRSNASSGI